MSNKIKKTSGPKTDEGKAISSRNSTTHGLTARHWLDVNEQSLYDETVKKLTVDFDPQTSIEKILISKLAECTVRLMRTQKVENAMFDLARSEAGFADESIKSLGNGNEQIIQAACNASFLGWQFDSHIFINKTNIANEIGRQNLSDITGWVYVGDNMPIIASHIIRKCINENLNLCDFFSQEINQSADQIIKIAMVEEYRPDENMSLPTAEIVEGALKISSSSLQQYLSKLVYSLINDLKGQLVLKGLDQRIQQIKDAAMPDTKKLSLIQRYRTADERQFSKTLGELLELQKIRNNI